ncbi:MAG: hypothetical protein R2742_05840 [Micropruina glycogenica]
MIGKLEKDIQHKLRHTLESLDGGRWTRENDFRIAIRKTGIPVTEPLMKALVTVFGNSGKPANLSPTASFARCPTPPLRDTENVPLDQDIDDYLEREIHPWVPDAWIHDDSKTQDRLRDPFHPRLLPIRAAPTNRRDRCRCPSRDGTRRALFAEVRK